MAHADLFLQQGGQLLPVFLLFLRFPGVVVEIFQLGHPLHIVHPLEILSGVAVACGGEFPKGSVLLVDLHAVLFHKMIVAQQHGSAVIPGPGVKLQLLHGLAGFVLTAFQHHAVEHRGHGLHVAVDKQP